MIVAAICAVFVWLFFRFVDKSDLIDGYTAAALVLAPAIAILLLTLGGSALGIPAMVLLVLNSLYFLVPLFVFRATESFSWKRSFAYSAAIFALVVVTSVLFQLLIAGPEPL